MSDQCVRMGGSVGGSLKCAHRLCLTGTISLSLFTIQLSPHISCNREVIIPAVICQAPTAV